MFSAAGATVESWLHSQQIYLTTDNVSVKLLTTYYLIIVTQALGAQFVRKI